MGRQLLLLTLAICAFALQAHAQTPTDVTSRHLTNAGFDENFNYNVNTSGNVAGDVINSVSGWTKEMTATYTVAGTFAYGSKATFNGSSAIPDAGYKNSAGGALGLTTGWGSQLKYVQTVSLKSGKYSLASAYYNAGTATAGSSLLGWLPTGGKSEISDVNSFPVGSWRTDTLHFTVLEDTQGKIQIGFASIGGVGSANNAKILVDYVHLIYYGIDKSGLNAAIVQAEALYDAANVNAELLLAVIDEAKAILENEEANMLEITTITEKLTDALFEYQLKNASKEKPLDLTYLISNPSFENSFTGWINSGFATQTNVNFPKKAGKTYAEKWVNRGSKVPDVSIQQQLDGIPNGKYTITVSAGNIQQAASGSTVNNSATPQTGVKLFAGYESVAIDTISDRAVHFVVIDNRALIGLKAENATGNWVMLDNFRLHYTGENNVNDYAGFLNRYISEAQGMLTEKMQRTAKQVLEAAIAQALQAISADPLVQTDLSAAKETLDGALDVVALSKQLYDKLQTNIDYANQVLGWYSTDENKKEKLEAAISVAVDASNNFDLTAAEINSASSALNTVVAGVDKQLYTNSLGNVNDPNNTWTLARSRKSKNWILFWEAGYGENPASFSCGNYTANVDNILKLADEVFDFYTDSLKFTQRGSSKSDKYRMIIRLRYTSEWEASGSGVDNQIGLLTLTAWSGQAAGHTLAHEVGHCFQYQVHCDNGDWNGWMYGFGNNASGGNGWWEQCAQWQGFKFYPAQQFTDGRFNNYMNTVHKHIIHETPRYDNYFIQDYWTYRHGMDIIGRLWNESKSPEDPVEAYKRITGITQEQFNDEIYDCAARFATWDIPDLRSSGSKYIASRPQPAMTNKGDNYWMIHASVCLENTGHNIIKLNAPATAKRVTVYFEGKAGESGFRQKNLSYAGWRFGFVALLKDGTRIYSDMGSASYSTPTQVLHFDCPADCSQLWLVVTGAPSTYWRHAWDDDDSNDEQWPYQVKFNNTNRSGYANVITGNPSVEKEDYIQIYASGTTLHINQLPEDAAVSIFNITGNCLSDEVASGTSYSTELPSGIYIIQIHSGSGNYYKKIIVR